MEIMSFTLGPVQTNAYLVGDSALGEAIIIDPAWDGDQILAAANEKGWRITNIWLTHAHFDHYGGAAAVADGSNPPPPVALHPDDYWLWRNQGGAAAFGLKIDPGPEPSIDLQHGMKLYLGETEFQVRFAPGHSRGHVMFYVPTESILFCGDVIFRGSIGRTDLPGADHATLMKSIETQVMDLPDETYLLNGHGPITQVGIEREHNPFLQS